MYLQYFGLTEKPFSLTPDTEFFYNNRSHREVLNTVLLALKHSEGFIKIVGEVGTGKTLLCRKILSSLGDHFITAYIPNPYLSSDELRGFIADEIGVEYSADTPAYQLLKLINQRLIDLARERKQVVLVVDEAQAMPRETIESLRLLTNLETEKRKLLQVVLIGQPELDELLARDDLRQLKQRIVFSEYLQGLDRKNLDGYIQCRLVSAGHNGETLFSRSSLHLLHRASGGTPRLVNVLAHKALMVTYGRGAKQVSRKDMARAIKDTDESLSVGKLLALPDTWIWPVAGGLSALALVAIPYWLGVF